MRDYYRSCEIFREDGSRLELHYYRLTQQLGGMAHYGAEIVLLDGLRMESASARWLTTKSEDIRDFLELLYRNAVTPCALQDVVADKLNYF